MQNLSQNTVIKQKNISPDILIISRTFFPKEGGIEEYVYNRCLQDPERVIVLAATVPGSEAFDQTQPFPIHRWYLPKFFTSIFLGSIIKQIVNIVSSFFLAIKLYYRYHYHYIEWGHGYDFPAILLLSYFLPIRFCIYLHGNDILCPLGNPLLRSLFGLTLKRAAKIVCNSSFTKDYLISNSPKFDTPIHIINPVVRSEKFGAVAKTQDSLDNLRKNVRAAYNIPETSIVILSVGRLVKRKGFDRIVQNLTLLLTQKLDVHYILCGQGPMESELKSMVHRSGMENRVHFAGFVPDNELAGYYAACDIFAMLTFFDSKDASIEGFGIVYIEAGYFGKPVIASRVGGIPDAVHHEETGLLVEPNSAYEMLQAFTRLCKNEELRKQLGRKGQEFAQHKAFYLSPEEWS
jgi:glycosyltransferase involved in cell wall biosynthesis